MTENILVPLAINNDIHNTNLDTYECLICFEHIDHGTLLDFNNIDNIVRNCNCNGQFHKKCFYTWYQHKPSCPICNSDIVINNIEQQDTFFQKIIHYTDNNYCLNTLLILISVWFGCAICLFILKVIVYFIYS